MVYAYTFLWQFGFIFLAINLLIDEVIKILDRHNISFGKNSNVTVQMYSYL